MQLLNTLKYYWKSALVIVIILYLSFAHPSTFKKVPSFNNIDLVVHFLMYGGLSFILTIDFAKKHNYKFPTPEYLWTCIIFPIIMSGSIEIIQPTFFAPRTGSWGDFACNVGGVITCAGIIYFSKKRLYKFTGSKFHTPPNKDI